MLLCDPFRLAWSSKTALWCCNTFLRASQSSGQGSRDATRRNWDLEIFGRSRDDFFWKIRNMNPASLVLVALGNDLRRNVSHSIES